MPLRAECSFVLRKKINWPFDYAKQEDFYSPVFREWALDRRVMLKSTPVNTLSHIYMLYYGFLGFN